MISSPSNLSPEVESVAKADDLKPLLTIFAVPKAFEGHTAVIQRNAIQSWCRLRPEIEIILLGDDYGVSSVAEEFSLVHCPSVARNQTGTPQLDSVFQQAIDAATTPMVMYTNSDIVFDSSLVSTIGLLQQLELNSFLAIGQRTDFDQNSPLDFGDSDWETNFERILKQKGKLASILCKDYFIFRGKDYRDIPPFSIGRGNWDNWMVAQAARSKSPVIDVTDHLLAGHQNHDYQHAGGRMQAYVTGEEAKRNKTLAGGTNYVSGSVATHRLLPSGQLKKSSRLPLLSFVKDFPRVARLVYHLFRQ